METQSQTHGLTLDEALKILKSQPASSTAEAAPEPSNPKSAQGPIGFFRSLLLLPPDILILPAILLLLIVILSFVGGNLSSTVIACIVIIFSTLPVLNSARARYPNYHKMYTKDRDTFEQAKAVDENADENSTQEEDATPQTSDMYPCFRRSSTSNTGQWYLLPSALLVAGDIIAMNSETDRTGLKGCDVTRIEAPVEPDDTGSSTSDDTTTTTPTPTQPSPTTQQPSPPSQPPPPPSMTPATTPTTSTSATPKPLTRQQYTTLHSSLLNLISGGGLSIYQLNSTVLHNSSTSSIPPPPSKPQIPPPLTHLQLHLIRKNLLSFNLTVLLLLLIILPLNNSLSTVPLPLPQLLTALLIPLLSGTSGISLYASSTFWLECVGTFRIVNTIKKFTHEKDNVTIFQVVRERLTNENKLLPKPEEMVLERLPGISRICFVDDDLICGSKSCSPQQILLPTSSGLKLLDIAPKFEEGSDSDESEEDEERRRMMQTSANYEYHDSDSSDDEHFERSKRRRRKRRKSEDQLGMQENQEPDFVEMEFEDPRWWEHLPSLKGIGLAAMMVEKSSSQQFEQTDTDSPTSPSESPRNPLNSLQNSLVRHVSDLPRRHQLMSLASCIGFNAEDVKTGGGDLANFTEKLRIHFIKRKLHEERKRADYHALGLEEAKIRGKLFPHISSVIIEDSRSKTFQMLSVGEAELAINKCSQLWEGETSTIFPLSPIDRKAVLDTARNWILEDLSVVAFTYAPIPYTFELKADPKKKVIYLVDNSGLSSNEAAAVSPPPPPSSTPSTTPSADEEYYWKLTENQVFLGLLGSTSGPRRQIAPFITKCNRSGVRFVYFSPRNMRRSKELASKLGLEMGWNCAISLRSLHGQKHDEHRMISSYADWDVNAKLPHGISEIRKHLVDVDNVPLLVSLFTDSTEESTKKMIDIFKENIDTVLVLGCSHRAKNMQIFGSSDVSIGVNVDSEISEDNPSSVKEGLEFASSVITRDCFFNIELSALPHLHDIIEISRASLEAATAATQFIIVCSLSLTILTLLCSCTPNTDNIYVDGAGAIIFLLLLSPALAVGIAFGDGDSESMRRCPIKTDPTMIFPGRKELTKRSFGVASRALFNALGSFAVGLIVISSGSDDKAPLLILLELCLCTIIGSFGSLYRADVFWVETGWKANHIYLSLVASSLAVCIILTFSLAGSAGNTTLWPFFFVWPFAALLVGELIKKQVEKVIFDRAALLRRLEFETRLGMWSPR